MTAEYIEVETANLMKTAPPDPHIDPLKVYIDGKGTFLPPYIA